MIAMVSKRRQQELAKKAERQKQKAKGLPPPQTNYGRKPPVIFTRATELIRQPLKPDAASEQIIRGRVNGIKSGRHVFLQGPQNERIYVNDEVLRTFNSVYEVGLHLGQEMECLVFKNKEGLRAAKVLRIIAKP